MPGEPKFKSSHCAGFTVVEIEPTTRKRKHAVPNEIDGRERELHVHERLTATETDDRLRFAKISGNGLERGVKAEGHIPNLARENHDDRGQLQTKIAMRKNRDQAQSQDGKKTQDRNTLQNIDHRDENSLGHFGLGCHVSDDDGENEREAISDHPPHSGENRVVRKRLEREIDLRHRRIARAPLVARRDEAIDRRAHQKQDQKIRNRKSSGKNDSLHGLPYFNVITISTLLTEPIIPCSLTDKASPEPRAFKASITRLPCSTSSASVVTNSPRCG